MKNGKFFLLGAAILALAACGESAKTGEAFGLVHGAGYVGYATVTVSGDKITKATLTEYCFPSHVTAAEAEEGKTTTVTITGKHGAETKHFYNEVKFGSYTLTVTTEGYKTADGKTEAALFADDAAAKAWKEAVVAGKVEVNGKKDVMTNATICKDENGYGGTNFNWKSNRDKTCEAFVKYGKDITKAAKKTEGDDTKNWYIDDVSLGATWTDLNTQKDGTLSYAQLLIKALDAAK